MFYKKRGVSGATTSVARSGTCTDVSIIYQFDVLRRSLYEQYIALCNEAGVLNGFADYGAMWRDVWETPDFEKILLEQYECMQPLYQKIHAFARANLRAFYGATHPFPADGTIPAHLLGDMWSQAWLQVKFNLVMPSPSVPPQVDGEKVGKAMRNKVKQLL